MRRGLPALMIAAVWLLTVMPAVQGATPLRDGDRVVFYGDSITEQRMYTRYLQQYVYCRYPELQVRFFNAGWSGDRATGAVNRLERDVLSLNPTVVTLFFGMNDGSYKKVEESTINTYRDAMDKLITALKAKGIRVIVYAPGCVDYDRRPALRDVDYNTTLAALSDVAEELAKKHSCEFVDVHAAMLAFQTEQKAKDPGFTMIPDAVHPNAQGHLVMAGAMLEPFAEPMPTTTLVDAVMSGDGSMSVTLDDGFPFWIDRGSLPVAEASGTLGFVMPKLVIPDMPTGVYQLSVEGQPPALVTAEGLATGVPVVANTARAKRLHDLIVAKESLYFTQWREIRLSLAEEAKTASTVDALLNADEALQALIRDVAKPTSLKVALHLKPEGENLALKKKYETSDPNTHNWGIGGLTDGSWEATNRTCFATNPTPSIPKTATIDLEQSTPVGMVMIGVPPFGSTKTVAVSLSEDGAAFTEVGRYEFTQTKEERHTFTFPPRAARYVRLTYPDFHEASVQYPPQFAFTTEAEVYAKGKE